MSKKWRYTPRLSAGLVVFVSLSANISQVQAESAFQNTETLKEAVTQAVFKHIEGNNYSNIRVNVRSIDGRLRLKQCSESISASVTNPAQKLGRLTSEVRCDGETSWKVYIQATATAEMELPVLVRSLPRGAIISKQDIKLASVPVGLQSLPIAETIESLLGMEMKRQSSAGEPILLAQITAPEIVKRGQQINIRYGKKDLNVTVTGKALQNGANGEWITAENASSGRHVEGRVNTDGSISVPGF